MRTKLQSRLAAGGILLLTMTAALPAYGADSARQRGWQKEGDRWIYLDASGDRVCGSWVKEKSGRYYLDEDGYMVTNTIVKDGDSIYYTDENGLRVKNRWASESNAERICDAQVEVLWYYFGKDGKAHNQEGKALKLKEGSAEHVYFFDSDGHMLSGWQEITNQKGETNIYYLGDENQGYAHKQWQYLEPDEERYDPADWDYDSYEMFYFGYDGKMTRSGESDLEGEHFLFDENGALMTGWQPGITADSEDFAVNKYYDEETGIRAKGWFYASDPDDENSDPYWFYCDKSTGLLYNEGGRDSDDQLAYKRIDGKVYFFDENGHMITGLISTDGTDLGSNPYVDEGFEALAGDIGKGNAVKPAGIYYLSQEEDTLGQMQKDRKLRLSDGWESYDYYLSASGRAYTNTLVKGCIYGGDGAMLHSDSGWELKVLEHDIYQTSDYIRGRLREDAEPILPEGSIIAVNRAGKVKKTGRVKIDDISYQVAGYLVKEDP